MIQYPKMKNSNKIPFGDECIAFNKYDGSNFRVEWTKKSSFKKYGSRNQLIDETDYRLGEAVIIFQDHYASCLEYELQEIFTDEVITLFFEFYGENSFAGSHEDESKSLVLIDVYVNDKRMDPGEFLTLFGHWSFTAKVIYQGIFTKEFVDEIRNNTTLKEGVVVKTTSWMCKIKTNAYKKKLQDLYGTNWQQHWE